MSITWTANEIRDYLVTQGLTTTDATYYQTYIQRMTNSFTEYTRSSVVTLLDRTAKDITEIARGVYGLGLGSSAIAAWAIANIPRMKDASSTLITYSYGDAIGTDINTNLVGTPSAADSLTAKDTYLEKCSAVLNFAAEATRYFAGLNVTINTMVRP
jgi:hypothetical protein